MGELRAVNGLTNVRFAPNPLSELALSTMIVRYPERHPFHEAWYRDTAEGRASVGEDRVLSLINERKDVPDVLLRPAGVRATTFAEELRRVGEVPAARWREDLEYVWPDGLPTELGRSDDDVRRRALEILDEYWDACMARWWKGFKTVLDADVTFRAHELATLGPAAAIKGVEEKTVIEGRDVVLPFRGEYEHAWDVSRTPLTFLPTLEKWNHNFPNRDDADLVISYRARGRGRLSFSEPDAAPGLTGVLGATRTRLLLSLDEPASSTAIALFMGVTTSAANQHLRALAAAGLLDAARFGRYVLYSRSTIADELIGASRRRGLGPTPSARVPDLRPGRPLVGGGQRPQLAHEEDRQAAQRDERAAQPDRGVPAPVGEDHARQERPERAQHAVDEAARAEEAPLEPVGGHVREVADDAGVVRRHEDHPGGEERPDDLR